MSEYFNTLDFSWNWWFLLIPALLVAAYLFGRSNIYIQQGGRRDGQVRMHYNGHSRDLRFGAFATLLAGATVFEIICESHAGLFQMALNLLARGDDIVLSIPIVIFIMFFAGFFLGELYYFVARLGEAVRWHRLHR